jgi:hypothetical protein
MTSKENLDKKLCELSQVINSDERLVENVMSRIETKSIGESKRIKKLSTKLVARRFIMNPFTKFAAAAVIIVAAVLLITILDKSATPAYGINDVPGLLSNANTLHVKGIRTYILKGQEPISCPIEYWIDFKNIRYRRRAVNRGITRDGRFSDNYSESEVVFDTTYIMIIDHTKKTVRFGKRTPFRTRSELRVIKDRDIFLRDFYLKTDQLEGFEKTGRENIDGVMFDIWKKKEEHPMQRITEYYIEPSTGELGRYFQRFLYDRYFFIGEKAADDKYRNPFVSLNEDEHEWHEHLLTCIERDKPLKDDIFKLEPPSGYKITTSKDEASNTGEVGYQTVPSAPGMTVIFGYTLTEDGSVIMAWSDRSDNSSESQAVLFDGLEAGDPLPELTFVPYALHPIFSVYRKKNEAITYVGRHLAHTRKGNVHYEWSIYILDSEPPKSEFKHVLTYDVLVRRNPDDGQTRGLALIPDTTINSEEEFDSLVLGGMAELSDDGIAPDDVSYQSVLQLAEQIRESLDQ